VTSVAPTVAPVLARARPQRAQSPRARERAHTGLATAAMVVSLVLWLVSLRDVDPRAMTGLGLVSVLPPASFVALAVLAISFCLTVQRARPPQALLLAHVVLLVFFLYALPTLVEPEPRFAVTWRHVGIIGSIAETGQVDPRIDAYFNWPGFFVLAAFLANAAGLHDLLPVAAWAPVGFALLYLPPLVVLMRSLTSSPAVVWMAVWVFYLGNWIGQDYLSPQAFAFFLYLVLLAIVMTWVRSLSRWWPPWADVEVIPGQACSLGGSPRRAGMVAIALLVFAAIVPSHQLTPFAVLPGVAGLVIAGRCSARGLPVAMAVILGTWISFMTVAYLAGHVQPIVSDVGNVHASLGEGVAGRVRGDPSHIVVARVRLLLTGALWAFAVAAAVRRAWRGRDDVAPLILLAGPLMLPLLQPYGGEIAMRCFLFSLPITAFFVASSIERPPRLLRGAVRTGVLLAGTLLLLGAFALARYGNEQMDWLSREEVAAVDRLHHLAPTGSTLVAWAPSLPWKSRDYARYHYRVVTSSPEWARIGALRPGGRAQVAALDEYLRAQETRAYLVLTRSQRAQVDLTGLGPRGSVSSVERALRKSRRFRLLYANRDAAVFTLRSPPGVPG
jgi:hypothetical protein